MLRKDKPAEVERLVKLIDSYPVVGIIDIYMLPAKQLQKIKQDLKDKIKVRVAKKTLIKRALEKSSKKGIAGLADKMKGQPALILSKVDPFKLFKLLEKNKAPRAAKPGDIATKDIVIKAGPTDLQAGPAISTLQKVGLKTKVEGGKISIMQDKVICKEGETITPEVANVLSALKIEPLEIGLNLVVAWENGIIYERDVLAVDEEEYRERIVQAVMEMMNLSLNVGYLVKETAEFAIIKAWREMKSLGVEAGIYEKDVIEDLLAKASAEAKALEGVVKK